MVGGSAPASSQVVRIPGIQARPLENGPSIGTELSAVLMRMSFVLSIELLPPARRRVLPRLPPAARLAREPEDVGTTPES
jgi:hypothetical protein